MDICNNKVFLDPISPISAFSHYDFSIKFVHGSEGRKGIMVLGVNKSLGGRIEESI